MAELPEELQGATDLLQEQIEEGDAEELDLSDPSEDPPEWETAFMELHDRIHTADADRQLLEISDSQVPQFVKDRMKEAIRGGAVFHSFENIPSSELTQLREYLTESLSDDNWSIDGIADQIMQLDDSISRDNAETIARSETHEIVAEAREIGYKERGDAEDSRFYWTGEYNDGRTTECCQWLMDQTHPKHGGEPVPMDELKELVQEAPDHDPEVNTEPREWTPHVNCRKTYVRDAGAFE